MGKVKIQLGAGTMARYDKDYVNVDFIKTEGIDIVHNLNEYPWPFDDNYADEIKAIDLIEHLPSHTNGYPSVIKFIEECHRILKPGGLLFMQTPHWQSKNLWIDPTHVRGFDEKTFDYFDPDTDYGRDYGYYSDCKFMVLVKRMENDNLQISMVKR